MNSGGLANSTNIRRISLVVLVAFFGAIVVAALLPSRADAGDDSDQPWLSTLADYLHVSKPEAAAIAEQQGEFADLATRVQDKYPDEYVGAEWFGDHGVVTVTYPALEGAKQIVADADGDVTVVGVEGLGRGPRDELIGDTIDRLKGVLGGGDSVDVDPVTGVVTIGLVDMSKDHQAEVLQGARVALGDDVVVRIVRSEGLELYYDGGEYYL
jgi:hypothetical protein